MVICCGLSHPGFKQRGFLEDGLHLGVRETMARQQQIEAMKFWMKEGGYANE